MVQISNIRMYTLKELNEATGIAVETFRRWIKTGKLPAKKVARQWLVTEETVKKLFGNEE